MNEWIAGVLGGLLQYPNIGSQQQAANAQQGASMAYQQQAMSNAADQWKSLRGEAAEVSFNRDLEMERLQREISQLTYDLMFKPPRYVEPWWLRFLWWLVRIL